MGETKAYALMELAPGKTLNELAYMNPDLLEENRIRIGFQLGMHTAFSYVFGVKDGYQTNYLFDTASRTLTRIDNEKFLCVPENPAETLKAGDSYTKDIAACELENLKYIPSFRNNKAVEEILKAFNAGFLEKYREIKEKKQKLLKMIADVREGTFRARPEALEAEYKRETEKIKNTVSHLIDQKAEEVLKRLYQAKAELK